MWGNLKAEIVLQLCSEPSRTAVGLPHRRDPHGNSVCACAAQLLRGAIQRESWFDQGAAKRGLRYFRRPDSVKLSFFCFSVGLANFRRIPPQISQRILPASPPLNFFGLVSPSCLAQRAPNPPEFAQPRLSRVKRRSSPARGYKFGCDCSSKHFYTGHHRENEYFLTWNTLLWGGRIYGFSTPKPSFPDFRDFDPVRGKR